MSVEITSLSDLAALQQLLTKGVQSDALSKGNKSDASNPLTAPWVAMADGGFPFNSPGVINTPVIAVGTWVNVLTMTVPNGYDGVIKNIKNSYNGAGFNEGSGTLIWRILRNGQAFRGYENILVTLGDDTGITQLRIGSGDYIQFQVQNVGLAGAGTQLFCYFGGWYYPKKIS